MTDEPDAGGPVCDPGADPARFAFIAPRRSGKTPAAIWPGPQRNAHGRPVLRQIADDKSCPVCAGWISALCPACNGRWSLGDLARWCAARGVPGPLPFPARQDSPAPAPEVAAAWDDLLQNMVDVHSALDDLEAAVDAMLPDAPTVGGLRAAADAAAVLADSASSLSRAIHDAFPDVVAVAPATCAACPRSGGVASA